MRKTERRRGVSQLSLSTQCRARFGNRQESFLRAVPDCLVATSVAMLTSKRLPRGLGSTTCCMESTAVGGGRLGRCRFGGPRLGFMFDQLISVVYRYECQRGFQTMGLCGSWAWLFLVVLNCLVGRSWLGGVDRSLFGAAEWRVVDTQSTGQSEGEKRGEEGDGWTDGMVRTIICTYVCCPCERTDKARTKSRTM